MKNNLLLIAVLAFAFVACKKDRTCSCTVTKTADSKTSGKVSMALGGFPVPLADTTFSQPLTEITTVDRELKKVSKGTAKQNCFSYTEPYTDKTMIAVPASSFNLTVEVTETGTKDYSCKLK